MEIITRYRYDKERNSYGYVRQENISVSSIANFIESIENGKRLKLSGVMFGGNFGSRLIGVKFPNCDLTRTYWSHSLRLKDVDFGESRLFGSIFNACDLTGCTIMHAKGLLYTFGLLSCKGIETCLTKEFITTYKIFWSTKDEKYMEILKRN